MKTPEKFIVTWDPRRFAGHEIEAADAEEAADIYANSGSLDDDDATISVRAIDSEAWKHFECERITKVGVTRLEAP